MTVHLDLVLVRPKEDGNVGAVARVAKNFGAHQLIIVAPRAGLGPEAHRRAMAGGALLKAAHIVPTFDEAKKIRRVVSPALTVFVGDALSGNDLLEQARLFDHALTIDGLVLNKLDADTRGGGALSVTYVTKKPILFVGVGQGYDDVRPFDPEWLVRRLFAEGAAA